MFEAPFWALVSLIIFLGVVVYLGVPRMVVGFLDRRAEMIRSELEQARKLREEAQTLLAEYQRKAREAESEAEEIVDQARREAEALTLEARRRMEEYVASRTRLAEEKIAQAEAQAVQEVRALSADVAVAAAERLLAGRMTSTSADALIDRTIADLREKLN